MTYYHKHKEEALAAGAKFSSHWEVRASLEPFNGWVTVLKPKSLEVFKYDLTGLIAVAELDLGRIARPVNKKRPPKNVTKRVATGRVLPPPPPPPRT